METVLIADHDLGFVCWLGAALGEAGFQVIPARSVRRASQMTRQFKVDVVIANPSLVGIAGFVDSLRRKQPHLKLIAAVTGPKIGTGKLTGVDKSLSKPESVNEAARRRWVDQVAALTGEAVFTHHTGPAHERLSAH